jgi:hypothetical protein
MTIVEKFNFIQSILREAGVTYWLFCGGLLLAYRDHRLPEDDIDFGLLMTDYEATKAILLKYKDRWTLFNRRSRELTIKLEGTKFDFVFHEINQAKNLIYMYSYKQNPFCNMKWNYEWRAIFPIDIFLPVKTMTFNIFNSTGQNTISTPVLAKPEEYFATNYEWNWYVPKDVGSACWTYDLNPAKDKNYNPIAVIMTTIARDEILLKVLPSYLQYPVKLYLLDQGTPTKEKDKYYTELRSKGHFIEYANDIGLSAARNYLLDQVEEEFIFMTEDDIELTTNPYSLFQKFWNNNLGILGGLLIRNGKEQHYEYALELKDNILNYVISDKIDLCLNFFLAKKKVFDDIRYDENLKLCEHTDWFLRLKELNKWKVDYTRNLQGIHHTFKPQNYMNYRGRAEGFVEEFKKKWGIVEINKNNELTKQQNNLTVFVLTHDNEPNYELCMEALKNQGIEFKLDVIKNFHPMSAAFQEMLNRCSTPYYVEVDSDMILEPDAIERLYNEIITSDERTAMICHKLHDVHLDKSIDGIKIYKYDIFKNYPYENVMSCEMAQLEKLEKDGYNYIRNPEVIGTHCPIWTKGTIFERYFNYMEKLKKFKSDKYSFLLKKLLSTFLNDQTKNNLYAFLGAVSSSIIPELKNEEKDYTIPILTKFELLDKTFDDFVFDSKQIKPILQVEPIPTPIDNRILVLQIAGIPCANRPYDINRLINAHSTKYRSRHILGGQYSKKHADIPYREFPFDLLLTDDKKEILKLIQEAKIIHIHHRIDNSLLREIPKNKKIIFTVSNLGSSIKLYDTPENANYNEHIKSITNILTVTDQPMQKLAYNYLTTKTLPLVKFLFGQASMKNNPEPIIVFAPTNRRLDEATSKGYYRVLGVIYKLQLEGLKFKFDLIEGVPYEENLKRKQVADIIIDDVINENFHNTSIEGACFGAAVVTNYHDDKYPFIKTTLNQLEDTLHKLLTNPEALKSAQQEMINWSNNVYTPENILAPFEHIYDEVLKETHPTIESNMSTNLVLPKQETIVEQTHIMEELIQTLSDMKISYWVLNETCLEIVKTGALSEGTDLHFGVRTMEEKNKLLAITDAKNIKTSISIEPTRKTKSYGLYGTTIQVPVPLVRYLENLYLKPFNEIIK